MEGGGEIMVGRLCFKGNRDCTYFSLANTTSWCQGSFLLRSLVNSVCNAFASFSVL